MVDLLTQCLLPVRIDRNRKLNLEFHRICKLRLLFHISLLDVPFRKQIQTWPYFFQLILFGDISVEFSPVKLALQKLWDPGPEVPNPTTKQQESPAKWRQSCSSVGKMCVRVVDTSWIHRLQLIYCTWHLISKTELLQRTKMLLVWKSPN